MGLFKTATAKTARAHPKSRSQVMSVDIATIYARAGIRWWIEARLRILILLPYFRSPRGVARNLCVRFLANKFREIHHA